MKLDLLIVTAVKISRMLVVNNNLHVGCFICCYISTHTHTILRLLSTIVFFYVRVRAEKFKETPNGSVHFFDILAIRPHSALMAMSYFFQLDMKI